MSVYRTKQHGLLLILRFGWTVVFKAPDDLLTSGHVSYKKKGGKIEACRSDFRGKSGVRGCHFSSQRLELLRFLVPNFNRTSAGCCFKTHFKKRITTTHTCWKIFLTDVAPFTTSVVTVCVPGPRSSLLHTATTLLHKVDN